MVTEHTIEAGGSSSSSSSSRKRRFAESSYQVFLGVILFALTLNVSVIHYSQAPLPSSPSSWHSSSSLVENPKNNPPAQQQQEPLPTFAICLLTKDDLGILPEWLAYHYHAVDLKHLIVAVDPSSTTNPQPLFAKFQTYLPNLQIEQWSDKDFMPTFFLNGTYDLVPNFMGVELHDKETYGEWHTTNHIPPRKVKDMRLVNNHRYRQTRFVSQCASHLRRRQSNNPNQTVLMSLLDSDEFLVVNPWIIRDQYSSLKNQKTKGEKESVSASWSQFKTGSVLKWLVDSKTMLPPASPCIQVPRLLFGSVESNTSEAVTVGLVRTGTETDIQLDASLPRSSSPFETLRWKYHVAWNDTRNFQQKVILNLNRFPPKDEIFGDHINSVHRPSRSFQTSAVAAFHYMGSPERYFARPNDLRRNKRRYRQRSNLTFASEPGWIDQWLGEFVKDVGIDVAAILLENYVRQG